MLDKPTSQIAPAVPRAAGLGRMVPQPRRKSPKGVGGQNSSEAAAKLTAHWSNFYVRELRVGVTMRGVMGRTTEKLAVTAADRSKVQVSAPSGMRR